MGKQVSTEVEQPDDPAIGKWVVRSHGRNQGWELTTGVPHFVESIIADEPITSCGRRLLRGGGYPRGRLRQPTEEERGVLFVCKNGCDKAGGAINGRLP